MRLETALYSSSQGLYTHGNAISVVGDNISNASTTGFKSSRTDFEDLIPQGEELTQSSVLGSSGNGSYISDVKIMFHGGTIEYTGRALDTAIDGNGFFILSDGTSLYYSRAGNFEMDKDGLLRNSDGLALQGYQGDSTGLSNISVANLLSTGGKETTQMFLNGNVTSNMPIASIPDNPQSFKDISEASSFIAGDINVYDSLGARHGMVVAFFKTGVNEYKAQAYIDGSEIGKLSGVPEKIGDAISLKFNEDGTLTDESKANATMNLNINYTNGASAGKFTVDLSNFTQYASLSHLSLANQDGYSASSVKDYEFSNDGNFYAIMDDDTRVHVANIPLADAIDKQSFERVGSSLYLYKGDSGNVRVEASGTKGLGGLKSSSLEYSNVDLADEFVDMILYQRGYQANSQVFNVAGTLIENTIAMIR
ncbi:MAG: flagellar hook protein FlgE [Bdellovibrionota bacterium]